MDENIFLLIYNFPHPAFLVFVFSIISAIGSYGAVWVLMALLLLRKRNLLTFFLGFIFLTAIIFGLQNFTVRLRPYDMIAGVSYLGFIDPGGFSFPSYHTASSFFGAIFLGERINKYKRWFWLLAILISFSRIYLGAHYLTDILGGAIIGLVVGWGVMKYGGQTNRNRVSLF